MMWFCKTKNWTGNLVVVSCLFFYPILGSKEANSISDEINCTVKGIAEKIDKYIEGNPELQARKKSGRWVALDFVISGKDLGDAYECIAEKMIHTYKKSKLDVVSKYRKWDRANKVSFYAPANDFGWGNIFVNQNAKKYRKNKYISDFAKGSVIVKESFVFDINGDVSVGPLFYMEKMREGFNKESNDWKFVEINLDGTFVETNRSNPKATQKCIRCHGKRRASDFLYFIPSN